MRNAMVSFCCIMTVLAHALIVSLPANAVESPGTTQRVLRSASELDYPPFALVREDGIAAGFSVDLLKAVTKAVGLDVNFEVGPWHEIKQKLVDGQIDVLPLVSYSRERDRVYDFTAPYLRMHGSIFVRKGERSIRDKSDLKDKEVIVMRGDTAHEYAVQNQLSDKLILTDTFEEAMRMLSRGKHDAVVIQQLVGLQMIKKLGISNIVDVDKVQETSLKPVARPLAGFEQKFCIAVKDGDRDLQAILNEGLAIVIAEGIYADLYDKWFGPILPQPPVPLSRILKYLFFILTPLLFLVALIGAWVLKREVARKTLTLRAEIEERKLVEKALYEKEEDLRITLNSIGDAVISTDRESHIVHMNPVASRLTGWSESEAAGKSLETVFRIINEYTKEMVQSPAKKVMAEGVIVGLANHTLLISQNGEEIPIADSGAPIKNREGDVSGVVLVFRDQSEERAAQKSLKESEERFRKTIINAPFPIMVHNEEGEVVFINDVWTEITGYTREEIPTIADWSEKAYGVQKNSVVKEFAGRYDIDKRVDEGEYRVRTKAGEIRVWLFSAAPVENTARGKRQVISMAIDITERKRAEQELKRLAEAVQQASESIVITSPDGTMIYANPAFTRITGYQPKEIIGQTPRLLKSGQQEASFYRKLWETILAGNRWFGRIVNKRKDGSFYTAECSISPVNDLQGHIVNFVWMSRDITKDLEAEKKLAHSQRIEAIGALAGGIAHDFNNLLFPIIGLSEMLLEDMSPEMPNRENVEEIHKAAKRAGDLVKQILSFSRQSEDRKIPVRIQQVLKEVLKLSRSTIPSNIEIQSDIQTECGRVMADPTQLHQIAMNLITNAYHAVEDTGGKISVSLKETEFASHGLAPQSLESGRYAMLTVTDTGIGIDPSVMNRIFEPYFTTKAHGKGTGLGLSVVYGILKEHGGDIRVDSEVGKGAAFSVYLPLMEKTDESTTPEVAVVYETGNERVLLVDDEEAIARLETQMLERLGYRVIARTGSIDALEAFRENPSAFDLVLTDMTMPNMTGTQLARNLLSIRADIPIIICTGFSEKTSEEKAKANGIRGFLMKPVVKSDMAKMVRKVLDEAQSSLRRL